MPPQFGGLLSASFHIHALALRLDPPLRCRCLAPTSRTHDGMRYISLSITWGPPRQSMCTKIGSTLILCGVGRSPCMYMLALELDFCCIPVYGLQPHPEHTGLSGLRVSGHHSRNRDLTIPLEILTLACVSARSITSKCWNVLFDVRVANFRCMPGRFD